MKTHSNYLEIITLYDDFHNIKYRTGQKVHSGFPIADHGKTECTFWPIKCIIKLCQS